MASFEGKKVLVTGATGNVGGGVIRRLGQAREVEFIAGVRSPGNAELGVTQVCFDFNDPDSMARALVGIDRVLMVTGYTVDKLMQGKTFIDEARKAGVSYFVHLGSPGDDDTRVAHYGWEQLVERYLEWSGIGFTRLRPQIYIGVVVEAAQGRLERAAPAHQRVVPLAQTDSRCSTNQSRAPAPLRRDRRR
jgi:NAD(P)H dehydrogenase (quinone)